MAALWMRGERPLVFIRFARLLLVIGVALVLRAIQLGAGNELAWHGCLVAAAVIPLLATLYIEALLRRQAHLVMKLVLLTGTAIFAATSLTPLIHDNGWWALSFAVYHVVTLGYVALLALLAAPRARRRVERSLFAAHALGGIACTALLVTDWLPTFQIDSPRLGAVGVFFLVYIVAAALSGGGAFRLRWLLLRVAIAGSVCASLAILVSAAAGVEVTWVAFLVLLFAYLVAEPLRLSLVELRSRPGELLVERLASLPARSLEAYLAALRQWPEIKVVDVIAP